MWVSIWSRVLLCVYFVYKLTINRLFGSEGYKLRQLIEELKMQCYSSMNPKSCIFSEKPTVVQSFSCLNFVEKSTLWRIR